MKKVLSILSAITLGSTGVVSVVACYNPLRNGANETKPPNRLPVKDIKYYQALIKEIEAYLIECQQWIKDIKEEWKNDKTNNRSNEEYQLEIDQVSAELYFYQAEINQYQYQILLLEKQGDKFTSDQILQGIAITTEKIANLKQELSLKEKYPKDYPKTELQAINDAIKKTIAIKEVFIKMKEEESKCDI